MLHWEPGTADDARKGVPFRHDIQVAVRLGGFGKINAQCPGVPDPYNAVPRMNIRSVIEELGTWPEKWEVRERQVGVQGGQFLNAALNATYIKSNSCTRKKRALQRLDLRALEKPWGILIRLAHRVALREVVAEVITMMMEAWMEKSADWQALMPIGDGVLEELRNPNFLAWIDILRPEQYEALTRVVTHVLRKLHWTGMNEENELIAACPTIDDPDGCIHIPMDDRKAFASILEDTERSATFACLTTKCFEMLSYKCQTSPKPKWQRQVPALVTTVCQYRWLGANQWEKMSESDLQNDCSYWMGSSSDMRRLTAEVTDPHSPTKLRFSNRPTNWRYMRRAWERYEKIRQVQFVQLRERTTMTEEFATEVIILRE
ncbi:hypothetical protein E4T47_04115 [Aureobasidium subglaciale]|nr:hypothetical protein E4T47_04115 [Aureobasidium subglaciale]